MATSGVTTWQLNTNAIINAALRKAAVLSEGQTANTAQLATGLEALNSMLKAFQTKGMPLWAIREYAFPLTATKTYAMGIGQTINSPAPLKIIQAYIADTTDGSTVDLFVQTHNDYNLNQPQGPATGCPINLEQEAGLQIMTMRLWPSPDAYSVTNRQIHITYQRPFEDMVGATDNMDFPQYWTDAVIYGLAWRLAPEYGVPLMDRDSLGKQAMLFLEEALSFGLEEGSFYIMPAWNRR